MLKSLLFVLGLLIAPAAASAEEAECGGETACQIDGGSYHIHLPSGLDEKAPKGAIFYLHGHRGKAVNAIRNRRFQALADELGVAFVAVQGVNGTWSFPTAPRDLRDEYVFFDKVLSDISLRFGVERNRTMLSGFSSGAFMTWYTACEDAGLFSGYAPIAGAFWKPLPDNCPSRAPHLFHVHGTTDTVVPLEGRPLGGGRWHQGDVFESFDVWRRQTGLADAGPQQSSDGDLSCERWSPEGGTLELCLHDGGHSVRASWLKRAWFELAAARGWELAPAEGLEGKCQIADNKLTEAERSSLC